MSAAGSCRRLRLRLWELLSSPPSPLGAAAAAAFVIGRTGSHDFVRRNGESSPLLVCRCGSSKCAAAAVEKRRGKRRLVYRF
ncbi:hypothetical protein Droror1_Dr00017303 [Drosera rotundifolia]